MDRSIAALALLALSLASQAAEEAVMGGKARVDAVAAAVPRRQADAPFNEARDPFPELFPRDGTVRRLRPSACDDAAAKLCYDSDERRVVYRPAREYMPRIQGLTAESVSLRRDRLVLKYSFR